MRKKQNYVYAFNLLKTLSILYFFLHHPTSLDMWEKRRCQPDARIFPRGEVSFAKFPFLPSWFAKLLEVAIFSGYAKIRWMPS
jgi:hypothetical protein